jgi:uncharacterized lipoprotein YehR (DUF1307 family)
METLNNNLKIEAQTTICVELFRNMLNKIENKFNDLATLKNSLKYNEESFNNSLRNDFIQIVKVLQGVIDKYYFNYYNVDNYEYMSLSNLEESLNHNKMLLNGANKLLKFID